MPIAFAFIVFAALALFRPRIALAVILFLIPFGHLVRFTVVGVPFTFSEFGVYVFAGILALQYFYSSFRASSEKSHNEVHTNNGVRSLAKPAPSRAEWGLGMTKWWKDALVVLPFLWILVAAIAAWYSPNVLRAWGIWKAYFLAPVALFFVMRTLYRSVSASGVTLNHESRRKDQGNDADPIIHYSLFVIRAIAIGAFVIATIAIAQWWWPIGVPYPWSGPRMFRATSVFGYPNAVGLYLAPLVPLFGGLASRIRNNELGIMGTGRKNLYSLFFILTSVIAVAAITLARSTGALVALAIAMLVLVLLRWRRWPSHHPRAAALAIIGGWLAISFALTAWLPYRHEQPKWGPPLIQKLTFQKWSGSVRLAQYRETWALLRDHPIRGVGLAGYQTAIRPYHEDPRVEIFLYPHNLLLAVWVELGLVGLLVFLVILYATFKQLLAPRSSLLASSITSALLVILVHGLVDVPYFKNDLAMLFWVIVAIGTIPTVLGTIATYGGSVATGVHSSAQGHR